MSVRFRCGACGWESSQAPSFVTTRCPRCGNLRVKRLLLAAGLLCGAALLGACGSRPGPRPSPAPSSTAPPPTSTSEPTAPPTAAPPPTAEPTCPPVRADRIACRFLNARGDGKDRWDCSPKVAGGDVLPEDHPLRAQCDLESVGGAPPLFGLAEPAGTLAVAASKSNPFQFFLAGAGEGVLVCLDGDGRDLCRGLKVSR